MHRIAASWFGVRPADLGDRRFSTFRKWAVGGLSVSLAIMSALIAWLAFQKPRPENESKLARAIRAYLARRRKPIVRVVEKTVEVPGPERVVEVVREVPGPERKVLKYLPQYLSAGEMELRNRRRGMPTFHPKAPAPIPSSILEASND